MPVRFATTIETPEAQLRSLIDRANPKDHRLIRSVRTAMRKRFPTANELVYDYTRFLVISYAPTDRPTDGFMAVSTRDDQVRVYFMSATPLPDPAKLLRGSAKQARYIPVEGVSQLAHPDVEALIAAVVERAMALPTEGRGRLIIKSSAAQKRAVTKQAR